MGRYTKIGVWEIRRRENEIWRRREVKDKDSRTRRLERREKESERCCRAESRSERSASIANRPGPTRRLSSNQLKVEQASKQSCTEVGTFRRAVSRWRPRPANSSSLLSTSAFRLHKSKLPTQDSNEVAWKEMPIPGQIVYAFLRLN